jgi:hypothetical protein
VRISPNEVHLNNVENYEKIYHVGSAYAKDPSHYGSFGLDHSGFCTLSNELQHGTFLIPSFKSSELQNLNYCPSKIQRKALEPMFSKKMVLELVHVVKEKARKLSDMVGNALESGKSRDL